MSNRNRLKTQRGGHSGERSERGAGRGNFDQKRTFKKNEYDNRREEDSRKDISFYLIGVGVCDLLLV